MSSPESRNPNVNEPADPVLAADPDWLLETEQVTRRRRREPLTRGAIVVASLRIIDDEGVEALSMRRLGLELDVRAMALYRHVRNKEQLLDLIVEGILRGIEAPLPTGDWRNDAAAIGRATRAGLMRHRRAVHLVGSRPWVGAAGLTGLDATLGVFRGAGFDPRTTVYAQFALGNYVGGFCAWEAANLGSASGDPAARSEVLAGYRQLVAGLPPERFPNLVALAGELTAGTLDERFEFGLAALLDGIAALR